MQLPVMPPVAPMLAKAVPGIPDTGHIEPKWDGFRTIVFRDGDEVELGSRNGKPLTRYFPDVVDALKAALPERCVVDGEIVVARGDRLDFESLQLRIHPAASRVTMLAEQTPASLVAFDLLASGDKSWMERPFAERRARLTELVSSTSPGVHVTPATADLDVGAEWLTTFEGAGLDGVVAKPLTAGYTQNKRTMFKIKHERTADCVVAGFRWHTSGPVLGSLLLGLYDDSGDLHHVGVCASFTRSRRAELITELDPYRMTDPSTHPWAGWLEAQARAQGALPGAQSRWAPGKDLSWVPVVPDLVVEVAYDHMEGERFRHTAQFRRWRPDRDPASCGFAQLERPLRFDLADVLRAHPPGGSDGDT